MTKERKEEKKEWQRMFKVNKHKKMKEREKNVWREGKKEKKSIN